jgi:hypothetical protein
MIIEWYRSKKDIQELLWITKYMMAQKIENWEVLQIEVERQKRKKPNWEYKEHKPFYVYVFKKDL